MGDFAYRCANDSLVPLWFSVYNQEHQVAFASAQWFADASMGVEALSLRRT